MLWAQSRWFFAKGLSCRSVTTLTFSGSRQNTAEMPGKPQLKRPSRSFGPESIITPTRESGSTSACKPGLGAGGGSAATHPGGGGRRGGARTVAEAPGAARLPPSRGGGLLSASVWTRVLAGKLPRLRCALRISNCFPPSRVGHRAFPEGEGLS